MSAWDRLVNSRRWAATGTVTEPTTAQADTGFSYLGANPPSVELFNALFQLLDDKDNWLFWRLQEVMQAAGITPASQTPGQLLNAIRAITAPGMDIFTESRSFVVPTGITRVKARLWGGGGGGGGAIGPNGAGMGGGGGGYAEGIFTVTPGQSIFVTVGKGGAGAPANAIHSAQPGGSSSFGSFCTALGGSPGVGGDRTVGAAVVNGGGAFGANIIIAGTPGGNGQAYGGPGPNYPMGGGVGGSSPFGGSNSHLSIGAGGTWGIFPGGGACGAGSTTVSGAFPGGTGANGFAIVEW